jgi:hypothetical protein
MSTEKSAYVRMGFRPGNVHICALGEPLPEELFAFGTRVDDYVRITTRKGQFRTVEVALDFLRDRGWTVAPDVPQFTREQIGYITTATLHGRGWTFDEIQRFLSVPDRTARKPSPSQFAMCRVTLLEQHPELAAARRREAEQKAHRLHPIWLNEIKALIRRGKTGKRLFRSVLDRLASSSVDTPERNEARQIQSTLNCEKAEKGAGEK